MKRINNILGVICITIGLLINTLWIEFNTGINPPFLNIFLSILVSAVCSYGFIFGLLKKFICYLWRITHKTFNIHGDWFIIYRADDYPDTNYIRIGKLKMEQKVDIINMKNLIGHTPQRMEDGTLSATEYCDNQTNHQPSAGSGIFRIDTTNNNMVGQYNLHRDKTTAIIGLLNAIISEDKISGDFFNGESNRGNGKPTWGRIQMFRKEKDFRLELNNLSRQSRSKS